MRTIYFTALLFTAGLLSCTKEKIIEVEKEVPVTAATITITSPEAGDTVANGKTVHLLATITGKATLHGYDLSLVSNDESVVFYKHGHVHNSVVTIDTSWVSNVTEVSEMAIRVAAVVDHDGNAVGKMTEYIAVP
jgi:hypothetical protein